MGEQSLLHIGIKTDEVLLDLDRIIAIGGSTALYAIDVSEFKALAVYLQSTGYVKFLSHYYTNPTTTPLVMASTNSNLPLIIPIPVLFKDFMFELYNKDAAQITTQLKVWGLYDLPELFLSQQPLPLGESETPLGGAASYTGTIYPTFGYRTINCAAKSDQAGTLYVYHLNEKGTLVSSNSVAVTAGSSATLSANVCGPFAQLKYVNGATPQTSFLITGRMLTN